MRHDTHTGLPRYLFRHENRIRSGTSRGRIRKSQYIHTASLQQMCGIHQFFIVNPRRRCQFDGDQFLPAFCFLVMVKRVILCASLFFLRFCLFLCLRILGKVQFSDKICDIFRCRTAAPACHIHTKSYHLLHSVHKIFSVIPGEDHASGDHLRVTGIRKGCEEFICGLIKCLQDPVHMRRTHAAVKAHGIDLFDRSRSLQQLSGT